MYFVRVHSLSSLFLQVTCIFCMCVRLQVLFVRLCAYVCAEALSRLKYKSSAQNKISYKYLCLNYTYLFFEQKPKKNRVFFPL